VNSEKGAKPRPTVEALIRGVGCRLAPSIQIPRDAAPRRRPTAAVPIAAVIRAIFAMLAAPDKAYLSATSLAPYIDAVIEVGQQRSLGFLLQLGKPRIDRCQ
jgi:hypothetical protein